MDRKRKVIKTLLISLGTLVAVSAIGYAGVRFYLQLKEEVSPVYHGVPSGSFAILDINAPSIFWSDFQETEPARQLEKVPFFRHIFDVIRLTDSVSSSSDALGACFSGNKMLLSLHYRGGGSFSALGLLQLPNTRQEGAIVAFMEKHAQVEEMGQSPFNSYKATLDDTIMVYFSVPKGIFVASFDRALLEKSLSALDNDRHILSREDFSSVYRSGEEDVQAKIYFNHTGFHRFLAAFATENMPDQLEIWSGYAHWAAMDLRLPHEGMWLSGSAMMDEKKDNYLHVFSGQAPEKMDLQSVLPASTAILNYFSFEDFISFHSNYLQKTGGYDRYKSYVQSFTEKYNINPNDYMLAWVYKEMARNIVQLPGGKYVSCAILRARDSKEALHSLQRMGNAIDKKEGRPSDTVVFRGVDIHRVNDPYLFVNMFGQHFSDISSPWYVVLDDYVVFCSSLEGIEYVINDFLLQNTLAESRFYQEFSPQLTARANAFLYYNLQYAAEYILPLLDDKVRKTVLEHIDHLINIPLGGFQYQVQNGSAFANFYIKADTGITPDASLGWQLALEEPPAAEPAFISDHRTGQKNIVVFDRNNQMYLVDLKGTIQWKQTIKETPLGPVEVIDYYNNGRNQCLFATRSYIYCIDLNGEMVSGFPLEVDVNNTSPVAAFDYLSDGNYRFIFAGEDNVIRNINKDGNKVRGWYEPEMDKPITGKMQRVVLQGKDFIIAACSEGDARFFNRRGEQRLSPEPAFTNHTQTPFHKAVRNGQEYIMTTDQGGRIIFIDKEGVVEKLELNDFSPEYAFLYDDFTGDGRKDYIFADNGYVFIYDADFNLVFKRQAPPRVQPEIILGNPKGISPVLVLRSKNDNRVHIIREQEVQDGPEESYFSDFPPLMYYNQVSKELYMILFNGKRIESILLYPGA